MACERRSERDTRGGGTQRDKKVLRRGAGWPVNRFSVVDRAWEGDTVVCIGGGPSVTAENVAAIKGRARVIAINNAYLIAPFAELLYFADKQWFDWHKEREEFQRFAGQKCSIFCTGATVEDPNVHLLRSKSKEGLSLEPDAICTGGNSGYQAVNIAVLAGAKRILLFGYDMKFRDGKTHWHSGHPAKSYIGAYQNFIRHFDRLAPTLKSMGIQVINCCPDSSLKAFERRTFESALLDPVSTVV